MEINTIEQFNEIFNTEEKCIEYMWKIRETVWNECPKCCCTKLYIYSNGKYKKCSNQSCRTRITITQGSVIRNTKFPLKKWFEFVFMFTKTNGRFSSTSVLPTGSMLTAYVIDEQLKLIFTNIIKQGVDKHYIFNEALKNIYFFRDKAIINKEYKYSNKILIEPREIIDLGDKEIYARVLLFARRQLYYALNRGWIFLLFCEPEDLVTETFLSMVDNEEITEVTGELFITMSRKTQHKMWWEYVKAHPKIHNWIKNYTKNHKTYSRQNLSTWYLLSIIRDEERENGLWRTEKTNDEIKIIVEERRNRILTHRIKTGYTDNIEFINIANSAKRVYSKRSKNEI